jgi:hypothetical protein
MKTTFIPLSYSAWFESKFNNVKAFDFMSKRSLDAYGRWCDFNSPPNQPKHPKNT